MLATSLILFSNLEFFPFLIGFFWCLFAQIGKASACNAGDRGSIPGSGRSPGEGNGNPLLVLLPRKVHGWRSLVGYSPWGRKESDRTERLHSLTSLNHILQLFLSFSVLGIIHLLLSREARHSVLLYHILSQPPNITFMALFSISYLCYACWLEGIFFPSMYLQTSSIFKLIKWSGRVHFPCWGSSAPLGSLVILSACGTVLA